VIARPHVHVFDEAHDDAGAAEVGQQVHQRVVIDAALYDGVDLDGRQAGTVPTHGRLARAPIEY